jgi:general secretion pathway protein A
MYLTHWNLREEPFQNVTDPHFAYLSDQHREGLARLVYAIRSRKLGGVLMGPYGVGKSLVLELLSREVQAQPGERILKFDIPPGGALALARQVHAGLVLPAPFADTAASLEAIRTAASDPKSGFLHTTLALDEAQMIRETETYEYLHLLTNIRLSAREGTGDQPAFTVILAGHEQLSEVIARDPSLCQRLPMTWKLDPLQPSQVMEYIQFRMRTAGGDIWVFDEDAVTEVSRISGGIPRLINNICDVALMIGCATGATRVDATIVRQAVDEVKGPAPEVASHG